MVGRLFKEFEQAVGCFLHECRRSEDGERAFRLNGRTVVSRVNRLAHLSQLDEQLGRIGRNDEHVGVGLDQDAGFALVGIAQVFAGRDGFRDEFFEVCGIADPRAVAAPSAEVGQAAGFSGIEAVDHLGQHQREGVFSRAARSGQDERMGKAPRAHGLAQVRHRSRVAEKIAEAHGMRIEHLRSARDEWSYGRGEVEPFQCLGSSPPDNPGQKQARIAKNVKIT